MTKMETRDKNSHIWPSPPLQRPRLETQRPPNRQIREQPTPTARQLRPRPRRKGERAPATLFHSDAISPNSTAPPRTLPLLSTRQGPRTGVPPLSRRRGGRRRGREPPAWPAAERGHGGHLLIPSLTTVAEKGKVSEPQLSFSSVACEKQGIANIVFLFAAIFVQGRCVI